MNDWSAKELTSSAVALVKSSLPRTELSCACAIIWLRRSRGSCGSVNRPPPCIVHQCVLTRDRQLTFTSTFQMSELDSMLMLRERYQRMLLIYHYSLNSQSMIRNILSGWACGVYFKSVVILYTFSHHIADLWSARLQLPGWKHNHSLRYKYSRINHPNRKNTQTSKQDGRPGLMYITLSWL